MIKFLDLEKINKQHSEKLKSAVNQVIDSGWYVLGKEVERFEKQFAKFHHVDYAIACSNGFDALKIILKAYIEIGKLKEGDEVLIPANTFIASALAISEAKLKPVLVEVNPENYLIDYQQIEKHISSKTKAFMNVHLYGQASYSEELREVIQTHNLIHIEDNAQAIAAEVDGIKTGNLGDAAAFSFYPGKNMGALGDAGAILCKDKALAEACRMLSNYGSSKKYVHQSKGHNHRMDEIQAAVLNVKLNYIESENAKRQAIAARYCSEIKHPKITLPTLPKDPKNHVWHLFVIRSKTRNALQKKLADLGIQTLIHYPIPIHKQAAYASEFEGQTFPITETLCNEILSLPLSPVMTEEEISTVINTINSL